MKTLRRKRKGASGAFLWDPARYWRHHLRPTFAGRPAPTGEELHLVSVGTGLPAMGGGKQVIPQANSRQQGKSCILSLWELACKRRVAQNGHHRRRIFAGRPAPTRQEVGGGHGRLSAAPQSAGLWRLFHPRNFARLEAQVGQLAFFGAADFGVVQAADFQGFVALFAAPAHAFNLDAARVGAGARQGVFGF